MSPPLRQGSSWPSEWKLRMLYPENAMLGPVVKFYNTLQQLQENTAPLKSSLFRQMAIHPSSYSDSLLRVYLSHAISNSSAKPEAIFKYAQNPISTDSTLIQATTLTSHLSYCNNLPALPASTLAALCLLSKEKLETFQRSGDNGGITTS